MRFFWINLDSAVHRRETIEKEFTYNNIEHTRVTAYQSPNKTKNGYESACTRSHIQAIMHYLLTTNDEYALICEDDTTFELKPFWKNSVEYVIDNAPSNWGIIQLATILQGIESKFSDKDLYFKYSEQKTSSTLAYAIKRQCAIKLINLYLENNDIYKTPPLDAFNGGIYDNVDKYTEYTTYTYKYPMFIYPDDNDSSIGNSLDLHISSKRQLLKYLQKM